MSTIKTDRIEAQNGSSLVIATDGGANNLITVTAASVTLTPGATFDEALTCVGLTSAGDVNCAIAPTTAYHLCNKTYVDNAATITYPLTQNPTTSTTFPWTYTFPADTYMVMGTYTDQWIGVRDYLEVTCYTSAGVTVGDIMQLANVNQGGNTDVCNYTFRLPWAFTVPVGAAKATFTCNTGLDIYINQVLLHAI